MDIVQAVIFCAVLAGLFVFRQYCARWKIPFVLVVLCAGIVLGNVSFAGVLPLAFPGWLVKAASFVAVVLIVFSSALQVALRELDSHAGRMGMFILSSMALGYLLLRRCCGAYLAFRCLLR